MAGTADLDEALEAAARAFPAWRKVAPFERAKVMRKAADLMRRTPGRVGSVVRAFADEVMVVGDLHGNMRAFKWALAEAALDANPRRHLVLQELVHEINKHNDDRPDLSHRLVDLVCADWLPCAALDGADLAGSARSLRAVLGPVETCAIA